jgi:hypothetical protein
MGEQQGRQAAARASAAGGGEVWVSFRLVREPCFRVSVQRAVHARSKRLSACSERHAVRAQATRLACNPGLDPPKQDEPGRV